LRFAQNRTKNIFVSFTEIKEQVAELPLEERFQLSAFLTELDERNETEFRGQADRRMKDMDAGKKISAEEFERRHRELQQSGR
jgi:hypothetical protein